MIAFFVSAKQERLLRRRAPRNPPANLEASQSATVSSTSSSPECNATTVKRVSCQLACEQTLVSGFAIKRCFADFRFGALTSLRWLHRIIIYRVARASVMF